jgi:hypothetical protein
VCGHRKVRARGKIVFRYEPCSNKLDPNASRLSICEQGCGYVAISVGQASDHSNARNFPKLPFTAGTNFSLFRLAVNPELVIRPKNDLLARRFPVGRL